MNIIPKVTAQDFSSVDEYNRIFDSPIKNSEEVENIGYKIGEFIISRSEIVQRTDPETFEDSTFLKVVVSDLLKSETIKARIAEYFLLDDSTKKEAFWVDKLINANPDLIDNFLRGIQLAFEKKWPILTTL